MKSQIANKIKIGIVPAAGSGRRLGYLSGLLPKALFPLYDRPIIHFVVDQLQVMGVEDIYIIVNVFKEKIIEYFKLIQMDLRANIYFIEQKVLNGTGESILLGEKYTRDQPFVVMYGDDCTVSESLKFMPQFFLKTNATVMEVVVKETDVNVLRNTCSVKLGPKGQIKEIIEKPETPPYLMRGCGVYMFRPEIYDHIRKTPIHPLRKEREITYTIDSLSKLGKAYGYLINGHNININDHNELLKASLVVKDARLSLRKEVKVLF